MFRYRHTRVNKAELQQTKLTSESEKCLGVQLDINIILDRHQLMLITIYDLMDEEIISDIIKH